MKYFFIMLAISVLASCKQSVTGLPAKIIESDSMAINWFKGDGSMDTVITVKIIKDKTTINTLAKMAGGYVTTIKNCGYDGSLHFFKMDRVIQDITFRVNNEACNHFSFVLNGQAYTTELGAEAKALLSKLH
jgi:hypothetical protein